MARGHGPAWVVAVSGGGDSVALLRWLHGLTTREENPLPLRLSVAHLNHGARGEAARLDAEFAAGLADQLGLPFDLGRWSPGRESHFEADARHARLAWLRNTARARGAAAVATGHTRDDQAETVLHRVVRGTGLRGLAGIPPRRALGEGVTLVRPFLTVGRTELRTYLDTIGQPFREDATNEDTSRTRARIRHELLPGLAADYNPRVSEALARLARAASVSLRAVEAHAEALERLAAGEPGGPDRMALRRDPLSAMPPRVAAEVIRSAWRRRGWPEGSMSEARWLRVVALARSPAGGRVDVGDGVVAESGPEMLILQRKTRRGGASPRPEPATLPLPGSADFAGGRVVLTLDLSEPCDETVDLDRLAPLLVVRFPRYGDRFAPLGLESGSQPLNDFFRGRKLAPEAREKVPLVCDAEGIVWAVGHRIADRVKLTPETTCRAGFRWEAGEDSPGIR
ncbi:MAG: tRNA lysidine(34) synthetase TilS [Isosphaeraceae bacterium]